MVQCRSSTQGVSKTFPVKYPESSGEQMPKGQWLLEYGRVCVFPMPAHVVAVASCCLGLQVT